jgi:mannose-6-phosphate isomerase-like protein (cupin superfamily)
MKIIEFKKMKRGWFIGDFEPSVHKTKNFEVSYKIHKKNEKWDIHYHEYVKEINLLIKGEMILQNKKLKTGDIFILEPFEIANPKFIKECHIICIKTPSMKDKIIIKNENYFA